MPELHRPLSFEIEVVETDSGNVIIFHSDLETFVGNRIETELVSYILDLEEKNDQLNKKNAKLAYQIGILSVSDNIDEDLDRMMEEELND